MKVCFFFACPFSFESFMSCCVFFRLLFSLLCSFFCLFKLLYDLILCMRVCVCACVDHFRHQWLLHGFSHQRNNFKFMAVSYQIYLLPNLFPFFRSFGYLCFRWKLTENRKLVMHCCVWRVKIQFVSLFDKSDEMIWQERKKQQQETKQRHKFLM